MKTPTTLLALILLFGIATYLSCKKEYSCEGCSDGNIRPVANAGSDRLITLPYDTVQLDGTRSYDPDGEIRKWFWTRIAGPAGSTLTNANTARPVLSKFDKGVYRFELKVEDNGYLAARDTVQITIKEAFVPNRPPIANAGPDQMVFFPVRVVLLDGSASKDPDDNIVSYEWKKIYGPIPCDINDVSGKKTPVTGLTDGVYFFELKVTDAEGLFSRDTVKIVFVATDNTICDFSTRMQVPADLNTIHQLSKPRVGIAVASVGDKIIFAGGRSNATLAEEKGSSRVDIYNKSTQTWSTAELSAPRYGISTVTVGNKVFFAGGETGDGYHNVNSFTSVIDVYDASTNSWSVSYLTQPRSFIASTAIGNKVFFAGGRIGNNTTTNRIDVYDVVTGVWSVMQLSEARSRVSAVTVNNKAYFAGGHTEDGWFAKYTNTIDVYDNATGAWSVSYLTQPMGFIAGTAVGDNIYWASVCRVEIKNVRTDASRIVYLSQPGYWVIDNGQNAIVKDGKIIFIRPFGDNTHKFDIYDIETNMWTIGVYPSGNNLEYPSVISVDNRIYVAGGTIFGGITSRVSTLDF